jgi:hypothetical protein
MYCAVKSRALIIAGTTIEKMGVDYERIQRPSIYHTATVGDIPFEVIQRALRLLDRDDLVSASLSCRAWRQATVELTVAQKCFNDEQAMESFFCGMILKSIVFGFDQYSIKSLDLDLNRVGIDYIRVMAQVVATSLSSLCLRFEDTAEEDEEESDLDCYEVLDIFLSRCLRIRVLRLDFFDFGYDLHYLTPKTMVGLGCLNSLALEVCRGDITKFVELAPIQTISKIVYQEEAEGNFNEISYSTEIISAIASKCRSLKSIYLSANFDSWQSILYLVEYCRDLEEIGLFDTRGENKLEASEFKALSSLSRLNSLDLTDCYIQDGALSNLARCKGLKHLRGNNIKMPSDLMKAIGGNLKSLRCKIGLQERYGLIVYLCPNLEDLIITVESEEIGGEYDWLDESTIRDMEVVIRSELKKLTNLQIDQRTILF